MEMHCSLKQERLAEQRQCVFLCCIGTHHPRTWNEDLENTIKMIDRFSRKASLDFLNHPVQILREWRASKIGQMALCQIQRHEFIGRDGNFRETFVTQRKLPQPVPPFSVMR